jgi:hypothetical protein
MKLIQNFHEHNNPVFHILGDYRWALRIRFIVRICHSPIKQITPFMHISLAHDTFPIQSEKLVMDFGKVTITFKKLKSPNTPHNQQD